MGKTRRSHGTCSQHSLNSSHIYWFSYKASKTSLYLNKTRLKTLNFTVDTISYELVEPQEAQVLN